ncbi:MAG: aminoacyl-tRNA hydrolase [Alphaproteobacteria bacterium]
MKLLVGLGNPGDKYRLHRHNIGFMAVDAIAGRHDFPSFRANKKFHGEVCEGEIDGERVILLKPTTFMNSSGEAIRAVAQFYKIKPEDVVVFHDELDLQPGKLRVKQGGGHAGHNGLRSTDAHVGKGYWRVRMGIGHPGKDRVSQHVLGNFSKAETEEYLVDMLAACAQEADKLAAGRLDVFASRVAMHLNPQRPNGDKSKKKAEAKSGEGKPDAGSAAPAIPGTKPAAFNSPFSALKSD